MKRAIALLGVAFAAGCSNLPASPEASETKITAAQPPAALQNGISRDARAEAPVQIAADGDTRNGPIEIVRVRVQQGGNAFYALPSGNYSVRTKAPVTLWVEWSSDRPLAEPPRLVVNWAENDPDNIHCGPCLLTKSYNLVGRNRVTVSLDDRNGGVTTRSFTLDVTFADVPGTAVRSESSSTSAWSITLFITSPTNDEARVSFRSITWHRADTGAQVGSQGDIVNFAVIPGPELPKEVTISGALGCATTGGGPAFFRFVVDVVSGNGARSQTPITSAQFPCF